jgi:hypothetical protein
MTSQPYADILLLNSGKKFFTGNTVADDVGGYTEFNSAVRLGGKLSVISPCCKFAAACFTLGLRLMESLHQR